MTTTNRPDALSVRTDRQLIRSTHHSARFVVAEVVAPPAPERAPDHPRPAANLALVLDRSGSMGGRKIELARVAVRQAIERLDQTDRFSLVVYDEQIEVVMPSTHATAEARRTAIDRLAHIDARGSTDLCGGWLNGAEQVAEHLDREGVNRVLLLTDGLANVGVVDETTLIDRARGLRERGIVTSTFGLGEDFNESLLQGMASAGGGAFRYIERAEQIADHLTGEVGEALEITAHDVCLEVTAPEGLRIDSLTPWPVDRRGERWLVRVGDLASDQVVRVVLRLSFPMGESGREVGALVGVTDRGSDIGAEPAVLSWRFAEDAANDGQDRDRGVDRIVARAFADRARSQVVGLNRAHQYAAARDLLRAVARRIRGYAGRDPELRALVDELEREAEQWAVVREERDRKVLYAQASYSLKMRDMSGAATRRSSSKTT